jgi:MOSC domain-containing protein YiiM
MADHRRSGVSEVSGRVEALWVKRAHRGKMDPVKEALLVEGRGVEGSVGRSSRRQVTIIEKEVWESVTSSLGATVDPAARRANMMVSGVRLAQMRGRILRIGGARISIGGETTPCERMDEAFGGLREALRPDWNGGVFGQVIATGLVAIGDAVEWEPAPA